MSYTKKHGGSMSISSDVTITRKKAESLVKDRLINRIYSNNNSCNINQHNIH